MVATAHPLAAQAGLLILQKGGNAVDAAIAAAAMLTVVEPTSNGIGGDAFALVWSQGQLYGLNASGPAPHGLTPAWVRSRGHHSMPAYGWETVTVPGVPAAWASLAARFGRLSLAETLTPAIEVAERGHPVAPTVAYFWRRAFDRYSQVLTAPEFAEWFRVFAPGGHPPEAGALWRAPDHARTLAEIARTNAESFYAGPLADALVAFSRETGGVITAEDLGTYQPEWVAPLSVSFHGYDVWELPPNGQGVVALMALKMLDGLVPVNDEERVHFQIEALKLAFEDGWAYVTDPRCMPIRWETLLDDAYLAHRRALIARTARPDIAGHSSLGGTVYLAAADGEGTMVSYIQSNYAGFGSGLVVPGTGIALQNRGQLFCLDDHHPNRLEPGKRPYHTIIPGFLTYQGYPVGPFGVMGGFMQPQGHVQLLSYLLERGLNPQAALDAPRFYWDPRGRVFCEPGFPEGIVAGLRQRGHDVQVTEDVGLFGRGQLIWRLPSGALLGATEPRADGCVAAW
ncbi:MAG: gamma-glutamyltransferase family protein [Firmicutes bacterium]|nr:gamma-glutamyltransferase family protein [Bacillota bacterium]